MKACAIAFPFALPSGIFALRLTGQSRRRGHGNAWKSPNPEFVMDKLALRSEYKQR